MISRRWILALAVVTGISGCTRSETSAQGQTPRHVDTRLATRARSLLGIALPCSLVSAVPYVDASSVTCSLLGADGQMLQFTLEPIPSEPGSTPVDTLDRPISASDKLLRNPTKRYQVYVGANSPLKPGVAPLQIGSPAESVFIDVLRNAIVRRRVAMGAQHPDPTAAAAAGVVSVLARQRAVPRPPN